MHVKRKQPWIVGKAIVVLLMLLLPIVVQAASSYSNINQVMSQIATTMEDIYPLIVRQGTLEKHELQRLHAGVKKLNELFVAARVFIKQKPETYQISYQLILEYLGDTLKAFDAKKLELARARLYAVGPICSSCHTQDTRLRTLFAGSSRAAFNSDMDYAEFSFLTRNYQEAQKFYEKYLRENEKLTELQLITPLQRIIIMYTQIDPQPVKGAALLNQWLQHPAHSDSTRETLSDWIAGLQDLQKSPYFTSKQADFSGLKQLMKKIMGDLNRPLEEVYLPPKEEISRIWLRGQVFHYLNSGSQKNERARLLFWLALLDRSVGYDYYFSLADLYLKQCMHSHSGEPMAARCYQEYEAYLNFAYSGSGGIFIPEEVELELEDLRLMLESAGHKLQAAEELR